MARRLVPTGDAAEELDSMYPVFRLREGDHDAIVAAPTMRAVKLAVHDFESGWDAYTENWRQVRMSSDDIKTQDGKQGP